MPGLKNPYLSDESQNYLIRKNYNIIKSPQNQRLVPQYTKALNAFPMNQMSNKNLDLNKNKQSAISISNNSKSSTSIRNPFSSNPFSSNTLGQRCENIQIKNNFGSNNSYYNTKLPSFYTQPYLPTLQSRELPFPSYNRPESNRPYSSSSSKIKNQLSFSRRNLAVSNAQSNSLQKNIIGTGNLPYRPHFVSPSQNSNNAWNSQKWRKQLQKQQRDKLKRYGPQALRFENKQLNLKSSTAKNFNQQYYSTKNIANTNSNSNHYTYKIYGQIQKKGLNLKKRQTFESDQFIYDNNSHNNNKKASHRQMNYQNHNSSNSLNSLQIPKDPDNYSKNRSKQNNNKRVNFDIRQENSEIENFSSKIQNFNSDQNFMKSNSENHHFQQNNSSMMSDYRSFVKDQDQQKYSANKFESKYQENPNQKKLKGPLNLDAFGSDSETPSPLLNSRESNFGTHSGQFGMAKKLQYRQEESQVFKQCQSKQSFGSKNKTGSYVQRQYPEKDYPQRFLMRKKMFYRIKLG